MTNSTNTRLRVHPDLRFLVAPFSEQVHQELKSHLLQNGCSTPIRVWENIVLVDYEAFEICKTNGIPMSISRIRLGSMEEATAWVCKNQLQRKDIPEKMRQYLIGKRFLVEKALGAHEAAKGRRSASSELTTTIIVDTNPYDATATKTCERLGLEYHISFVTVRKYGISAGILDHIRSKEPALAEKILSGKIKISHEHLVEISQLSPVEFSRMTRYFLTTTDHRPTYMKFRAMLEENQKKDAAPVTSPPTGTIKDIPAYDPDGEVCSLALTIPSWIGSINRTQTVSDFTKVSESAGAKLIYELDRLVYTVDGIRAKLVKEVYHGRS